MVIIMGAAAIMDMEATAAADNRKQVKQKMRSEQEVTGPLTGMQILFGGSV